ncbi:MAG: hypothetical protein M3Y49_01880 [Actinomycetota bacterium]|nr:hypothetical protein [Actinomycetota bacterium]
MSSVISARMRSRVLVRPSTTALCATGHDVHVVTRSGTTVAGALPVVADACDVAQLTEICAGSVAIYNCVNPPYDTWPQSWPPIARALLSAAATSGAVLATAGNLYPYGPMTQGMPDLGTGTKAVVRSHDTGGHGRAPGWAAPGCRGAR